MTISHTIGQLIYGKSVYKDGAAITGWIMILILLINLPFLFLRKKYYNYFNYTHFTLLVLFLPLLCIHAVFTKYFGFPTAWIFVVVPIPFYFYYRFYHYNPKDVAILDYKIIRDKILILTIETPFQFERGQYVYLMVDSISKLEFHPFSISNIPSDNNIRLIIQNTGDWTEKLFSQIKNISYVKIDIPMNSVMQHYIKYKKLVLIASGVGISPFLSIIRQYSSSEYNINIDIYLILIFRDQAIIDLFVNYISIYNPTVKYYIYYTGIKDKKNITYITNINNIIFEHYHRDLITNLPSKTHFTRPKWAYIFRDVNKKYIVKTGVFFCGSDAISKDISGILNSWEFSNYDYYAHSF